MPFAIELSGDQLTKLAKLAGPARTVEQTLVELIDNAIAVQEGSSASTPASTPVPGSDGQPAEREPWETKFERLEKLIRPFGGNVCADRESFYPEPGQ